MVEVLIAQWLLPGEDMEPASGKVTSRLAWLNMPMSEQKTE